MATVDMLSSQRRPLTDRLGLVPQLLTAAGAGPLGFDDLADPADTKLGPRWARGSEPRPVISARVWDGVRCSAAGKGGLGPPGSGAMSGRVSPGSQAASEGVMVMVQPGLSFCSCRNR
jgi:hypothetical protein